MPNSTQITELLQRGIAAAKAGRKQEARQALLQVTELDEQNEQAWLWLSGVVESLEDRRVCLENVLAINPDNANAQAGLRWLDQQVPAPPAARDNCPHCGAPLPPSGTACPHCGQTLIVACPACGQYVDVRDDSCSECGQLLGDFREGARYHLALAQAYLEHNHHVLAQEAIARAKAETSDDPQVLESMAALHEKMGHTDLAIAAYERAIENTPENAALYARLGAIYHRCSMPAEARAMYEQAAQKAGDAPEILFELARLYVEQDGATPEALKLLEQVVRLEPEHAPAHLLLGDVYLDQRRRKQAGRHYERASELTSPDSHTGQEARRKLAELHPSQAKQAQEWAMPGGPAYSRPRERPGCVTVYAILLGIGAALTGLGGILVGIGLIAGSSLITDNDLTAAIKANAFVTWGSIVVASVTAIFYFVVAIGLWRLKNWARIAVIVLQILGFLASSWNAIIQVGALGDILASSQFQWFSTSLICVMLFGLAINGYFIFWFVVNGDYFD